MREMESHEHSTRDAVGGLQAAGAVGVPPEQPPPVLAQHCLRQDEAHIAIVLCPAPHIACDCEMSAVCAAGLRLETAWRP